MARFSMAPKDSMPPYLEHIIRETGHRHYMALEEVHPETLDYLRPLLRRTLDTGETVQLPHTAWYLHAQTLDGRSPRLATKGEIRMKIILIIASLLWLSCAEQKTVSYESAGPIQRIGLDGQSYLLAAGKANQSDLSIELSYAVRNGEAFISTVTIDGVEYRSNCSSSQGNQTSQDPDSPEQQLGDGRIPHHEYCEDGVGNRDVDFTCDGYRNQPSAPGPEDVRIKVGGNEDYLRERFKNAFDLGSHVPFAPTTGGYEVETPSSYNLTDGKDDFFRIVLTNRAAWIISTWGDTDTWGDLYLDDNGSIKAIAGTGRWADRGNFAIQGNFEAGTYYLRVSAEQGGKAGTYQVSVFGVLE